MLIPFGVFSAAGAGGGGAAGSYELISTTIVPSAQASVVLDVSAYSSTYKHLQVRFAGFQTNIGGLDTLTYRLNGDTASNYTAHWLRGINTTVSSGSLGTNNQPYISLMAGSGAASYSASATIIDFLDAFSTSKYKTVRGFGGWAASGDKGVGLYSSVWMNTAAITSITLAGLTGNLDTGSRLSIYGIKA